jgi:hypothetical protein
MLPYPFDVGSLDCNLLPRPPHTLSGMKQRAPSPVRSTSCYTDAPFSQDPLHLLLLIWERKNPINLKEWHRQGLWEWVPNLFSTFLSGTHRCVFQVCSKLTQLKIEQEENRAWLFHALLALWTPVSLVCLSDCPWLKLTLLARTQPMLASTFLSIHAASELMLQCLLQSASFSLDWKTHTHTHTHTHKDEVF